MVDIEKLKQSIVDIIDSLDVCFICCKLTDIESDNKHEVTEEGSFIYFLLDSNKKMLYIGETGVTIIHRLKKMVMVRILKKVGTKM